MNKYLEFFLDLIFPKFCFGCGRGGKWVCESCREKILPVKTQVCPDCGQISQYGKYCLDHQKPHGLSGIITAAYYKEGPIKELIHNFKYNHILEIGDFLGELLAETLKENLGIGKNLLIMAVPMHFWRQARRGYNQSEILAEYIAGRLKLPKNFKIIKKIRKTKPQVTFSGQKRRKNLENSFKIYRRTRFSVFDRKLKLGLRLPFVDQPLGCSLKGKTIIIVDDVATTGTTLNECAKVLRAAGARRVWGLVVAKG